MSDLTHLVPNVPLDVSAALLNGTAKTCLN